jgi:hypothetical protein
MRQAAHYMHELPRLAGVNYDYSPGIIFRIAPLAILDVTKYLLWRYAVMFCTVGMCQPSVPTIAFAVANPVQKGVARRGRICPIAKATIHCVPAVVVFWVIPGGRLSAERAEEFADGLDFDGCVDIWVMFVVINSDREVL